MNQVASFATNSFAVGYVTSLVFWVQASVGALGLLCIHNITGGRWGKMVRPFFLWAAPTFPLLLLLFVPVFFILPSIYPWANAAVVAQDPALATKTMIMNLPFFTARSLIYFVLWCGFGFWVSKRMRRHVQNGQPIRALSGVTLLVLLFTFSFAAMDWIMTIDRAWSATGFGALALTGAVSNGVAFAILMTVWKQRRVSLAHPKQPLLIDLGNLLLMSVMLWAYLDFTQFLIIWSGQMPREIRWYDARSTGPWLTLFIVIYGLHFVVPFCGMLFRGLKRSPAAMAFFATCVLVAQVLENIMWAAPSAGIPMPSALITTFFLVAVMGLIWFAVIRWQERREPAETFRRIAIEVGT